MSQSDTVWVGQKMSQNLFNVIYEWSIRRKNCAICTQSTAIVANSIKEKKFLIGFLDIISKINAGQLEMIVLATLKRGCRD
jgi:hypothetical protein